MIGPSIIPIVVDTDNALGSANKNFFGGDVDDAFALAFLLKRKTLISSIYSVAGNTSAEVCHLNNLEICAKLQSNVRCYNGQVSVHKLENKCNYLALGPLTNLAGFLRSGFLPESVWMTLGRINTLGFFPPYWPVEFNATKDLTAFQTVLNSDVRKVIVPLDIAFDLKLRLDQKDRFQSTIIGRYLWDHSQRWAWRSLLLKGRFAFPVWDLVSAVAITHPESIRTRLGRGHFFKNGLFLCDVENKKGTFHNRDEAVFSCDIEIVTEIDPALVWNLFFNALQNP